MICQVIRPAGGAGRPPKGPRARSPRKWVFTSGSRCEGRVAPGGGRTIHPPHRARVTLPSRDSDACAPLKRRASLLFSLTHPPSRDSRTVQDLLGLMQAIVIATRQLLSAYMGQTMGKVTRVRFRHRPHCVGRKFGSGCWTGQGVTSCIALSPQQTLGFCFWAVQRYFGSSSDMFARRSIRTRVLSMDGE